MSQSKPIRRIIVPLDGSAFAEHALPMAIRHAQLYEAPILLLHVIDLEKVQHYNATGQGIERVAFERELIKEHRNAIGYLESVRTRLLPEWNDVSIEVRRGKVARELTKFSSPDDLMIIASHGRTGLARTVLGSVAGDVLRYAVSPVLLIPTVKRIDPEDDEESASN